MDYAYQLELEKLFNKNQLMPRLRAEYWIEPIVDHCAAHGLPLEFTIELLCQMALHKRTTMDVMVGILWKRVTDHKIPTTEDMQKCADLILKIAYADLVEYLSESKTLIVKLDVTQDVREELDRFQYPLPMVVEPDGLRNNRDTGYLTVRGTVMSGAGKHTNDDLCLDHLNAMNRVPLRINNKTAQMVDNQWADLDRRKEDETQEKFEKRVAAFKKYSRTVDDVMEQLSVASDGEMWITHKVDFRGRTYCQGYHVNPQGNEWNKAVIEFAEQEIVE